MRLKELDKSWADLISNVLIALLAVAPSLPTMAMGGTPYRNRAPRATFQRKHPWPSNGRARGARPGYVVDRAIPLCAHEAARPDNIQWQTRVKAIEKDNKERRQCRATK